MTEGGSLSPEFGEPSPTNRSKAYLKRYFGTIAGIAVSAAVLAAIF